MKNYYHSHSQFIQFLRGNFLSQGFIEIIPPILNNSIPLEPTIYPFETSWNTIHGSQKMYLPTSPERALKIALSEGVENCFSIAPSFRNLEDEGPSHTKEFLMFEWYREHADWKDIMKEVETLVQSSKFIVQSKKSQKSKVKSQIYNSKLKTNLPSTTHHPPLTTHYSLPTTHHFSQISMSALWIKHCQVDLASIIDDQAIVQFAQKKGYSTDGATWEQLFNQIFINEIEPQLEIDPLFITHFPSRISPLCKPCVDDPRFAERFEFYCNGIEIGNGNTENTDVHVIRSVFEHERQARIKLGLPAPPVDERFLGALEKLKGKSYAGVGIGVERLMKVVSGEC